MSGIQVSIGADYAALARIQSEFQKAAAKMREGFAQRIGQRAFDGLLSTARALPGLLKSALDAGGRLSDEMARTGAAGEGLVILRRAFEDAGMAGDDVARILGLMQKSIAGLNEDSKPTAETFAALGLSVEELRSQDPVSAFRAIGEAIMSISAPAERTALAMKLFGRSGAETLVLFSDPKAFENAEKAVGGLARTLAGNAASFDALSDQYDGLKTSAMQLGAGIASRLLPVFQALSDKLATIDLSALGARLGSLLAATARLIPYVVALGTAYAALRLRDVAAGIAALIAQKTAATGATAALTAAQVKLGAALNALPFFAIIAAVTALGLGFTNMMAKQEAASRKAADAMMEMNRITGAAGLQELQPTITTAEDLAAALEKTARAKGKLAATFVNASRGMSSTSEAFRALQDNLDQQMTSLEITENRLRNMTAAQMEANAARIAAANAEKEYQAALAKSNEEYEAARKKLQGALESADKARFDALSEQEKLNELAEKESAIREKIAGLGGPSALPAEPVDPAAVAAELDARRKAGNETPEDAALGEALGDLVAIWTERAALAAQVEKAAADEAKTRDAALADYHEELSLLEARAAGEWEKVAALQKQAALAAEIARLENAGVDAATAGTMAREKMAAQDASTAAERAQTMADMVAEAQAIANGKEKEYAIARRIAELEKLGVSKDEASRTAKAEAAIDEMRSATRPERGASFQGVSSMAAIGGGGNVGPAVDYQRQIADHNRRMVQLLETIAAGVPNPAQN